MSFYPGTRCTSETATLTVTSDCTPNVLGAQITSTQSIEVSTSAPGTYEVVACSSPVTITCERTGYTPATLAVTGSPTTVSLTCIGKNILVY